MAALSEALQIDSVLTPRSILLNIATPRRAGAMNVAVSARAFDLRTDATVNLAESILLNIATPRRAGAMNIAASADVCGSTGPYFRQNRNERLANEHTARMADNEQPYPRRN